MCLGTGEGCIRGQFLVFGGLAIFAGVMVTLAVLQWDEPKIRVAMLGGALMYLLGVVDDLKNLPAIVKLIGQTQLQF